MANKTRGGFNLDKPAKKSGADRYAGKLNGEDVTIYIPQSITRPDGGDPVVSLELEITV